MHPSPNKRSLMAKLIPPMPKNPPMQQAAPEVSMPKKKKTKFRNSGWDTNTWESDGYGNEKKVK
jgi:hypothetical protein